MNVYQTELTDVLQTGAAMRRLVQNYFGDLGPWLGVPFIAFYRHVCNLPYIPDPDNVETVSRPLYTLGGYDVPRDCDDKAVLLASWCYGHGEPVRFVATSTRPDKKLHHVFAQMKNGLYMDGTYPKNADFLGYYPFFRHVTYIEPLTAYF